MQKRGQAALEFMMTYGWAILVVIVAISALSYYGVLRADRFLPDECSITPGIACLSHRATTSTLDLVLQNELGQDIVITTVDVTSCSFTEQTNINSGDKVTLSLDGCDFGSSGAKLKSDIQITYRDEELISHTKKGQLITRIE